MRTHTRARTRPCAHACTGTSDGHRLLPLQVHQADPGVPALKAIDGQMLSLLLNNPTVLRLPVVGT